METQRNNVGALIGGAILIGIGLLSLLSRVYTDIEWGLLWPLAVIGFGALLGIALVASVESTDPTALVGLPLVRLSALLGQAGIDVLATG